ncbi:hypothetical protein JTB14_011602 [Gonioctena quinquepunctata]|nr:hypothetical protein JTB14_011602 [Gonioctena quinquepunctata]
MGQCGVVFGVHRSEHKNNFGKSDVSKLCIGTADSTPQENVGTIDHGIEENGPVESTLASGLPLYPTIAQRNEPTTRPPGIAAADDKGRRNAVPSAGKDNNLKGPSLVRLQHQVYIPHFMKLRLRRPSGYPNSKGVKTINKTPISTLADVNVLEGQDIPSYEEYNSTSGIQPTAYGRYFAKTGKPLEATKVSETSHRHWRQCADTKPPYRVPFQQQPVVRQHIEEMLQEDIIRPSASPFSPQWCWSKIRAKQPTDEMVPSLIGYTFTIQYRPGRKHANVDTLSRVKPIRYLGTEPTLGPFGTENAFDGASRTTAVRNITGNVLRNSTRLLSRLRWSIVSEERGFTTGDLLVAQPHCYRDMKTYP